MTFQYVTLYLTVQSEEEANHIAIKLVNERLVACANILPGVRSIYEWQGMLEFENEFVLLMKTREDKAAGAIEQIKALHTYDVPCITSLPISHANPDYLAWIDTQVR